MSEQLKEIEELSRFMTLNFGGIFGSWHKQAEIIIKKGNYRKPPADAKFPKFQEIAKEIRDWASIPDLKVTSTSVRMLNSWADAIERLSK